MSSVNNEELSTISNKKQLVAPDDAHHRRVATRPRDGIVAIDPASLSEGIAQTLADAEEPNTVRAYRSDVEHYLAWCASSGMPPQEMLSVAGYIDLLAKGQVDDFGPRRVATIRRRLTSIGKFLVSQGHDDVTKDRRVREVWKAIRRLHGKRAERKRPAHDQLVHAMADAVPSGPACVMWRAVLLFGQAATLRREGVMRLVPADVELQPHAAVITIRESKTNKTGEIQFVRVPALPDDPKHCPVEALRAWMDARRVAGVLDFVDGRAVPLFVRYTRRGRITSRPLAVNAIASMVKRTAEAAGVRSARDYSSHSLRAGGITSMATAGKSHHEIKKRSLHESADMVDRYVREAEALFGTDGKKGESS